MRGFYLFKIVFHLSKSTILLLFQFVLLILSSNVLLSQSTIVKKYDFKSDNFVGVTADRCPDNNFIMLFGTGDPIRNNIQLVKIDSLGEVIKTVEVSSSKGILPMGCKSIADGYALAFCTIDTFAFTGALAYLDSNFNIQWVKKMVQDKPFSAIPAFFEVGEDVLYMGIASADNGMQLFAFSIQGDLLWERSIEFKGLVVELQGASIDQDNNLYTSGYINDNNTGNVPIVIKLDSDGNLLWSKIYTGGSSLAFFQSDVNSDGLYLSGVQEGFKFFILKTDFDGVPQRSFRLKSSQDTVLNLIENIACGRGGGLYFSLNYSILGSSVGNPIIGFIESMEEDTIQSVRFLPFGNQEYGVRASSLIESENHKLSVFGKAFLKTDENFAFFLNGGYQDFNEEKCCFQNSTVTFDFFEMKDSNIGINFKEYSEFAPSSLNVHAFDVVGEEFCKANPASMDVLINTDSSCIGECIQAEIQNLTKFVDYSWEYFIGMDNYISHDTTLFLCTPLPQSIKLIANRNGCVAEKNIEIPDTQIDNIYFPNVFTPDGDSINDEFRPISKSNCPFVDYHLQIYNRWGEKVFESKNFTKGWDGKMPTGTPAPADLYIYTALLSTEIQGKKVSLTKQGEATLIR